MCTAAQLLANRSNSQSSTGPRTAEGKLASSRNALSHGLSSAGDPVLPHEDRDAFNQLVASYNACYSPDNAHEEFLVSEMVNARWRIERADRLETALLSGFIDNPDASLDPDSLIAKAMMSKEGDPLARIARHRAALERNYHRCAREFRATWKTQNEATVVELAEKKFEQLFKKAAFALPPNYERVPRVAWTERYKKASPELPQTPDPRGADDRFSSSATPLQNEPVRPSNAAPITPFVRPEPKIGRNDYCPCGSGLKYKKCCLNASITDSAAHFSAAPRPLR